MRGSTGTDTSTIVRLRPKGEHFKLLKKIEKKGKEKDKSAKQCQGCTDNDVGFCKKFKVWCVSAKGRCPFCVEERNDDYKWPNHLKGNKIHSDTRKNSIKKSANKK